MMSRYHIGTFILGCALAGCGSNSTNANASGDDATGAAHRASNEPATAGGEMAASQNDGCAIVPVYFGYDSSELDPRARQALETNAQCLQMRQAGARIIGMTDPRGTEEYNLALGDRRAQTVARYLANLGVEEQRLTSHSLGEENASGEDEAQWARDRRADIQMQ